LFTWQAVHELNDFPDAATLRRLPTPWPSGAATWHLSLDALVIVVERRRGETADAL